MTYTKKYGKGWFRESERHRLARLGVKTGRKINYNIKSLTPEKYPLDKYLNLQNVNYSKKEIKISKKEKIKEKIMLYAHKFPKGYIKKALKELDKANIEDKIKAWVHRHPVLAGIGVGALTGAALGAVGATAGGGLLIPSVVNGMISFGGVMALASSVALFVRRKK